MDAQALPRDREIYIVTDDGDVRQVQWCDQTKLYTGRDEWRRTDGESGGWEAPEIAEWSDDHDEIEDMAAHYREANGQFGVGA